MLSKSDIKKLVEVFATKQDLEKFVTKDEFRKTLDGVINKLDAVYGDLKDFRQEQTVHVGQHREINERLDILGKAVKTS